MQEASQLRVLLVEDDAGIGRVVRNGLTDRSITVQWLRTGKPALALIEKEQFDVVVLDLMLPDIDGFELCRQIRTQGNTTPVLMLTARDELQDKLDGFDVGADDYLTKPFAIDELVARLLALGRRRPSTPKSAVALTVDGLRIDEAGREVTIGGKPVELTRREFDVLLELTRKNGEVVSREQLLQAAWGSGGDMTLNVVDVYVGYLRRKFAALSNAPTIKTVRGIGFKLS
ncbi:MAG: response regulator transcription factor [Pseudomonadota bacterium]